MPAAITLLAIAAGLCAVLRLIRHAFYERPHKFPPGLPRLPLFGGYPLLLLVNYRHMHLATAAVARWYRTDVMGFFYRQVPVITVHSLRLTREVLLNPLMDGRAVFELVRVRDPQLNVYGIFFQDGAVWREQRRFTLRHLRDYGFGRRFGELEAHADEELLDFVDMLRNGARHQHERALIADGVLELPIGFAAVVANLFLKCVRNERTERARLGPLFEAARQAIVFQREACVFGRFFSLIPSWRYVFPGACGYKRIRPSALALHGFVRNIVDEEFATFVPGEERHFLDRYFEEMASGAKDTTFELNQLTTVVVDFILPALVGVSTAMCLTLKRLILNPDCMRRVQRDLDETVGRGRLPTLDDRQRLPYVEAMLRESLRLDTLVPSNIAHCALEETTVGEYVIPKGALVVTVLESVHRDDSEFADALSFRPQRFLDAETGALNVALDRSLPFGLGKRLCAGETFARNAMFLFVTAIVQNFDVSVPQGERIDHPDQDRLASGFSRTVPDFRLKFSAR